MVDREQLDKRIGKVLKGKWTLERLIGAGGMAAVYAARHEIGRKEAIKILHPEVAEDEELVQRFEREAHAVNRVEHPALVQIRDVDVTDDGEPFLVMELIEGESIARRMKKGAIETDEVLRIAEELLDALVVAHKEGVIHRDIKPSNLFLEPDGRLRVLDFGVARMERPPGTLVTEVGTQLGTVAYMPPEQLKGSAIDARADLYAVGATLFRMLSGEKPHHASSEDALARKIMKEAARPLARVSSKVPAAICAVVDRALKRDPDERYPDAATMQADIVALRQGHDPPFATAALDGALDDDDATTRDRAGNTAVMDEQARSSDDDPARIAVTRTKVDSGVSPTLVDDGDAAHDDDDTTVARDDDDATTRRRSKPPPPVAEERQSAGLLWLGIAAAVALVAWLALRSDETTPAAEATTGETSAATDDAPTTASGPDTASAPPEDSSAPPPPKPTATTSASAGASTAPPAGFPTSWPSALPTALPTSWPTALPTSWPTALPTSLPTAIPSALLPKPPPPPAPKPPSPAPAK